MKYLVIVVGHQYVNPMICLGNRVIDLLKDESTRSSYLYLVYEYNEKNDYYIPCKRIIGGVVMELSTLVQGLILRS